jgi:hypothetical protein
VNAHRPDPVLLDIALPVMDGLQALQAIRHDSPESTSVRAAEFRNCSAMFAKCSRFARLGISGGPTKAHPWAEEQWGARAKSDAAPAWRRCSSSAGFPVVCEPSSTHCMPGQSSGTNVAGLAGGHDINSVKAAGV